MGILVFTGAQSKRKHQVPGASMGSRTNSGGGMSLSDSEGPRPQLGRMHTARARGAPPEGVARSHGLSRDINEDSTRGRSQQDFELPERGVEDDLERTPWQQAKLWLEDLIFGRTIGKDGSKSVALAGTMSYAGNKFYTGEDSSHNGSTRDVLRRTENISMLPSSARDSPFIIHPTNHTLVAWEQVIMLLAAYSAFITPFEFAYFNVPPLGLRITDNIINVFFLVDIVLTFVTAYLNKKTYVYINDHAQIARKYAYSWFVFDVIGVFPWDTVYVATGAEFNGWQQVFRWLTWVRVLRARKVLSFFRKLQRDIRLSYFAVRIVKLLVVELYITHVAGCIFYFLALTYPPDEEGLTWIGSLTLGGWSYENFRELPLFQVYVTSMYWSVVTMATIGYGDIHPVNVREMVFAMIYISADLILSAYLVGNITALVVKGSNTTKYREKMAAVIKYMNRHHLPSQLRGQMRQHVRLQFETEQVEDEILEDFPLSIRHKVARALYKASVEDCYLFKNCSPEFISQIVSRGIPEYFFPSEVVILQRDVAEYMYIVVSGLLEEQGTTTLSLHQQQPHEGEQSALTKTENTTLYNKDAFGEVALLCKIPQPFTVVAQELSQVLRIDKEVLQSVINMFIVDGRQIVENLLQRTNEAGSKFAALSADIRSLIAQQEAELTMTTIYAASRGDITHLHELVRAGANPSKADYDGRSPLHLAAAGGYDEVVRFLLLEGADVNCRDNFGTTPLLEALRAGHDTTAKILMDKGGSVSLQEAGTDLCNAVMNGDTSLLTRLLEHGVDPNSADYDLRTPLHIAAAEGYFMLAKVLVEHGADVQARDRWGNTPLDEARRCGSLPLVQYLEEAMARKTGLRGGAAPVAAAGDGDEGQEPLVRATGAAAVEPSSGAPATATPVPANTAASADAEPAAAPAPAPTAASGSTSASPAAAAAVAASAGIAAAAVAAATGTATAIAAPAAAGGQPEHVEIPIDADAAAATAPGLMGAASAETHRSSASLTVVPEGVFEHAAMGTPSEISRAPSTQPSPMASPGRGYRSRATGPRMSYARSGMGAGPGSAQYTGLSPMRGAGKKRVTVYPFPPWTNTKRRVGRVMWLPDSLEELLGAARAAFNKPGFQHLLSADGGELTSLDLILDSDRLYLTTDKDMEEEGNDNQ